MFVMFSNMYKVVIRCCLAFVFCLSTQQVFSQKADTLYLSNRQDAQGISYKVQKGDNLFVLSTRFHVPTAVLADANDLNYTDSIKPGRLIYVPVGKYNYRDTKPLSGSKPVYYRVGARDNLFSISKQAGLTQHRVQSLNNIQDNEVHVGQILLLGWVLYDAAQATNNVTNSSGSSTAVQHVNQNQHETIVTIPVASAVDTVPMRIMSSIEKLYMQQTSNEQITFDEKGTAVFFAMPGKVSSTSTFFAFHNAVPRGTVIKVFNPGTQQVVFVKVLGPIPDAKQYHNCVIAISSGARKALGVNGDKAWCELKYVAY